MSHSVAEEIAAMEKMSFSEQMKFNQGLGNLMIKNESVWQKVDFIRRCYGLLIVFLLLSVLISIPFLRNPNGTMLFLGEHSGIMWLAVVMLFLQVSFYLTVLLMLKQNMNVCFRGYLVIMTKPALAYSWAVIYVSSCTLVVDTALTAWGQSALCYVYVYTLYSVMGLLLYTYAVKNADFKQMYAYLVPILLALLTWAVDALFSHEVKLAALSLSVLLGWMVVYETQLIFGTKVERGRKYPYSAQMYIMAAYEMYFDLFIHFYLGALNLFKTGDLDDPTAFEKA